MSSLQAQTAAALGALLGKQLVLTKTSGNLRAFHFTDARRSSSASTAEYALHVSCPWRIELHRRMITGSGDYYLRADDNNDSTWECGMSWGTVQQQALRTLFGTVDERTGVILNHDTEFMIVEAIETDDQGSAVIFMSGDCKLALFTCSSKDEEWRLLPPVGQHFVVEAGDAYFI